MDKRDTEHNVIGIIPARMASSRFPGKPLVKIHGIPMVGHCYMRSKMSKLINELYVATCDREIAVYIESIGGKAIMTADTHERASDRTAEALLRIEQDTGSRVDIVVMIQGDEPMLKPEMIDAAVKPIINDESIIVTNLMAHIKTDDEHDDINEVKVVVDQQNFALYFSRQPIPSREKGVKKVSMLKQVCIIPFRRNFLIEFNQLEPTPLEMVESVDMLRVIEHGYRIKMISTERETYSVDTADDLRRVDKLMKNDSLMRSYGTQ